MDERDSLAFGADARRLVDEPEAGVAAAAESGIEVVHGETDVMDPGSPGGHELADRGRGIFRFEQLHQRVAGGKSRNPGSVRIVKRDVLELEYTSIEGKNRFQVADGDANVRDGGASAGWLGHSPNLRSVAVVSRSSFRESNKMSNAVAVTDSNFELEVEQASGLTIVDFWATWCGPCRMIAPILDQIAVEHAGKVKITKLDVDANIKTASRFNVRSIPMLLFFKDGKVVDQIVGAVPKMHIEQKLQQHAA